MSYKVFLKHTHPLFLLLSVIFAPMSATADEVVFDSDVHAAIDLLLETTPAAKELAATAKGALVFPNVTKAGFLVGIQYGNGALIKRKQGGGYYISKYYSLKSGSYGFQAGVQHFGYAMLLMTDTAIEHIETSSGWEVGVGPTVVAVDEGAAKTFTTTTKHSDIYAFTFGQEGLMAGMGLQGTKITRMNK
jgi:lipid-binding SYLF domain-containing protein